MMVIRDISVDIYSFISLLSFRRILCNVHLLKLKKELKTIKVEVRISCIRQGLHQKRIKVVTEETSLPGHALIGVNSLGFGGSNVHVILRSAISGRVDPEPKGDLPHIHLITSRTNQTLQGEKLLSSEMF